MTDGMDYPYVDERINSLSAQIGELIKRVGSLEGGPEQYQGRERYPVLRWVSSRVKGGQEGRTGEPGKHGPCGCLPGCERVRRRKEGG